ncbi:MAG: glycosyltransferase family 39 protein, partial [Candidatus Omnitrophica bacterium]|nr:glycosyltransferase family 39 protein [Candidatus Omnitrophota bacterium]
MRQIFSLKDKKNHRALIVLLILIIALALRLYGVDRYTFWSDEASLLLDTRSVWDIFPLTAFLDPSFSKTNQDYLLMYNHLFIHYWRKVFGSSEFGLRFSSVIFSLASLWLMYIVGKHFFPRKSVFAALVLTCCSPMHIYYAQELRPYAALGCFFLLMILSVIKIVFEHKQRYWLLYGFVAIVSIYFHFIMVFSLCSIILYLIIGHWRNRDLMKKAALMHIGIGIVLTPVWIILVHNYFNYLQYAVHLELNEYPVWGGAISLIHLFCTLKNFSIGYAVSYMSWVGIVQSVLFLTLFTIGARTSFTNAKVRLLLFCILFPVASLFLLSFIKPCYVDRYVYYVLLLALLCVAGGLLRCRKRVSLVVLTVILAMNGYGLLRYYTNNYPDDALTSSYGITKKQNI